MKTDFKKKDYKKEFKNKDYEYKKPEERKTCGKCGRTHEFGTVQHISRNAIHATKRDIGQSYAENQVNEHIHKFMRITKLTQV